MYTSAGYMEGMRRMQWTKRKSIAAVFTVVLLWLGAYEKEAVAYEDENEVIIDFYADALLLAKACTVKFTLDDTDGYIRLDGTEVTYDSGLKIASYTT
jgi:hypothetical protein